MPAIVLAPNTLRIGLIAALLVGLPPVDGEAQEAAGTRFDQSAAREFDDNDFADDVPSVYVAQDQTHARCGPDGTFYRTDPLAHGQRLDVYVETEDGWLGVRPPENSFSWILADDVQVDSGDTATVVEDGAVVWIGTHLGRARNYRWQVQLAAGEQVTILGRSRREGPEGPQEWFRIVPPSGEFRWVHRDQVVESSEALIASVRGRAGASQDTPLDDFAADDSAADDFAADDSDDTGTRAGRPYADVQDLVRRVPRRPSVLDSPADVPRADVPRADVPRADSAEVAAIQPARPRGLLEAIGAARPTSRRSAPVATDVPPVSGAATGQRLAGTLQPLDGQAELQRIDDVIDVAAADRAIGSGLAADNRPPTKQSRATILSQPRVVSTTEVAQAATPSMPQRDPIAGDSNWVAGGARTASVTLPTAGDDVVQVGGIEAIRPQDLGAGLPASDWSTSPTGRTVSAARVRAVQAEASGADLDRLQLILSRLMADAASEAEVAPIEDAAAAIAQSASDPVLASRANLLVARCQQYRRIATRRDGRSLIDPPRGVSATIVPAATPSPLTSPVAATNAAPATLAQAGPPRGGDGEAAVTIEGTLVQIHSVRPSSPPYALMDNSGRTISYVTPNPGLNLKRHLNQIIRLTGSQSMISELRMPHLMAERADVPAFR